MGIRRHLTYANVTATLALVLALGAGGAYAVDMIGSGDVRNDSLLSKDLRDGEAVQGRDVGKDELGRREIDEADLIGSRLLHVRGDLGSSCALDTGVFKDCLSVTVKLLRRGHVLATGTGAFYGTGAGPKNAQCELRANDTGDPIGQSPGELEASTSSTATQGFARTIVFGPLPPGRHEVSLACEEIGGEVTIDSPTITAIAITGR
jgi:hypothetical protein